MLGVALKKALHQNEYDRKPFHISEAMICTLLTMIVSRYYILSFILHLPPENHDGARKIHAPLP